MKKLLIICITAVLVLSMSVSAFAAGGFVSSPSGNTAPSLVEGSNSSPECNSPLQITAYGDRSDLPEDTRKKIEEAYTMIAGVKDLSVLNSGINDLAKALGINVSDLAVSDLFDISAGDCDGNHADHGHFDITLKSDYLKNFVCLLHYYNGEWRIVKDAKVTNNGEHLEFDEKEFSPFAIVVATTDIPDAPKSSAGLVIGIVAGVVVVAGAAVAAVYYFKKKKI